MYREWELNKETSFTKYEINWKNWELVSETQCILVEIHRRGSTFNNNGATEYWYYPPPNNFHLLLPMTLPLFIKIFFAFKIQFQDSPGLRLQNMCCESHSSATYDSRSQIWSLKIFIVDYSHLFSKLKKIYLNQMQREGTKNQIIRSRSTSLFFYLSSLRNPKNHEH